MDPRIAWIQREQLGKAHAHWTRLLEVANINFDRNMNLNTDAKTQEYIPLESNIISPREKEVNANLSYIRKRKRENRASTYGLNHSSNIRHIERDDFTPWKRRTYNHGVIGYVFIAMYR